MCPRGQGRPRGLHLCHLIYADDICSFSPSIEGLQELINICGD